MKRWIAALFLMTPDMVQACESGYRSQEPFVLGLFFFGKALLWLAMIFALGGVFLLFATAFFLVRGLLQSDAGKKESYRMYAKKYRKYLVWNIFILVMIIPFAVTLTLLTAPTLCGTLDF